jgi:hypothetical protein
MENNLVLIFGAVAVVFLLVFVIIAVSIFRRAKGGHQGSHDSEVGSTKFGSDNVGMSSFDIGGSSFD